MMATLRDDDDDVPKPHNARELRSNERPLTKHTILNILRVQLSQGEEEKTLTFEKVNELLAEDVIRELDRVERVTKRITYNSRLETLRLVIIPHKVHEAHLPWLVDAIKMYPQPLALHEKEKLRILASPRYNGFLAPYISTRKEPDACILPEGMQKPTLVIESGWSESRPELHQDRDVWLMGAAGTTEAVLILKWSKLTGRKVKGDIEVWDLDPAGHPRLLQQEMIFPKPPPTIAASQNVRVTKKQLFGAIWPPNSNGSAVVELNVDRLRKITEEYIRDEGYDPA